MYILKLPDASPYEGILILIGVVLLFAIPFGGLYYAWREDQRRIKEETRKMIIDAKLDQDMVELDEWERRLS